MKLFLHKTSKATIHFLFNPECVPVNCSRKTLTDLARMDLCTPCSPLLHIPHWLPHSFGVKVGEIQKMLHLGELAELRMRREQPKNTFDQKKSNVKAPPPSSPSLTPANPDGWLHFCSFSSVTSSPGGCTSPWGLCSDCCQPHAFPIQLPGLCCRKNGYSSSKE